MHVTMKLVLPVLMVIWFLPCFLQCADTTPPRPPPSPAVPEPQLRSGEGQPPSDMDHIAAAINGEDIITYNELSSYARQLNRDKNEVLQVLIIDKLVIQAANKEGIKITDEEVDKRLAEIIKEKGGEEEFKRTELEPHKIDKKKYREGLQREMLFSKYQMTKINWQANPDRSAKIDYPVDTFVSPKEILDYFEAHRDQFTGGTKVRTRQIILKFKDDITRNSQKAYGEALAHDVTKETFLSMAHRHSEENADTGGLVDYTAKGVFLPEVDKIVFNMKVGEISPLIETEKNFRIVLLEDKIEATGDINSPDLQNRIRSILVSNKMQAGWKKITDNLVKKAHIWTDPSLKFKRVFLPEDSKQVEPPPPPPQK